MRPALALLLASCAAAPKAPVPAQDDVSPLLHYPLTYITLEVLAESCPLLERMLDRIEWSAPDSAMAAAFRSMPIPDLRGLKRIRVTIPRTPEYDPMDRCGFEFVSRFRPSWITDGFAFRSYSAGATVELVDEGKEALSLAKEVGTGPAWNRFEWEWEPYYSRSARLLLLLVRACLRGDAESVQVLELPVTWNLWDIDEEDGWLVYEDMALPLHLTGIAALKEKRFRAASDQFMELKDLFPLSKRRDEAAELAPLLADMARRHTVSRLSEPSPSIEALVQALPFEKPTAYAQPGGLWFDDHGPYLSLIRADLDAFPLLIKALEDRRPTGTVTAWRDFVPQRSIHRVCDIAAWALEAISGVQLPAPFHEVDSERRAKIAGELKEWLEIYRHRPRVDRYVDALAKKPHVYHCNTLAETIGEMGLKARSAAPTLIRLLKEDGETFADLVVTLGQIGAPEAREVLEKTLEQPKGYSRIRASVALDRLGFESGVAWFLKELPSFPEGYWEDKVVWNGALKHFWKTEALRPAIRGVLPKIYSKDPSEWPAEFRPAGELR